MFFVNLSSFPFFQQLPQALTNQQSSPVSSFPVDVLNSNSTPTIVTDSNGNQFLLTLSNQNTEAPTRGRRAQGKVTNQNKLVPQCLEMSKSIQLLCMPNHWCYVIFRDCSLHPPCFPTNQWLNSLTKTTNQNSPYKPSFWNSQSKRLVQKHFIAVFYTLFCIFFNSVWNRIQFKYGKHTWPYHIL